MGDDVIDSLYVLVQGWYRGIDNTAHLGNEFHVAQVSKVQRGFLGHEDKASAFFEGDVCGAGEEVI